MNWGYVHIALWNRFLKSQLNVENERERDSGRERKILTERERETVRDTCKRETQWERYRKRQRQWEIRVRERVRYSERAIYSKSATERCKAGIRLS